MSDLIENLLKNPVFIFSWVGLNLWNKIQGVFFPANPQYTYVLIQNFDIDMRLPIYVPDEKIPNTKVLIDAKKFDLWK